jgi:TM2 domain-containing membrane protein YozV
MSFCPTCGTQIPNFAYICPSCGQQLTPQNAVPTESTKSQLVAFLLCIFLGSLGIHRFYAGRIITGILMLLTLGFFGIWVLIDLLLIFLGVFKDEQGLYLKKDKAVTVLFVLFLIFLFLSIIFSLIYVAPLIKEPLNNVLRQELTENVNTIPYAEDHFYKQYAEDHFYKQNDTYANNFSDFVSKQHLKSKF